MTIVLPYHIWECSPDLEVAINLKKIIETMKSKLISSWIQWQRSMILLYTCKSFNLHTRQLYSLPNMNALGQREWPEALLMCMTSENNFQTYCTLHGTAGRQADKCSHPHTHTHRAAAQVENMSKQLWVAILLPSFVHIWRGNSYFPLVGDCSNALDAWERNVEGHYMICHARHVD